jgi:DNA-binding HxlR family transcriptional regulator
MRTYGQYCPIARAAEILAERWTPIILRNLLLGASTFGEIADGAPGISRTLLTARLRELERAGVVDISRDARGRGSRYGLTSAGRDLNAVMLAMGTWGERWMEMTPRHTDPGVVLDSWRRWYLAIDRLPERRVVARFDFPDQPRKIEQLWMIFDGERTEVCRTNPGFDEDLVVTVDSRALSEWHLGRLAWAEGLRSGRIAVAGPPSLARALPRWNRLSGWARLGIKPMTV